MNYSASSPPRGGTPPKTEACTARVRLRHHGPVEVFHCDAPGVTLGGQCIVTFDRGQDFGKIIALAVDAPLDVSEQRVLRPCKQNDLDHIAQNAKDAHNHIPACQQEIAAHHLPMKIVEAEYTFDRSKIVFYFAAEDRVDFRTLVRALAHQLKTRIELRQVGIRDETKILGGVACCGRATCCSSWIQEFTPVNIRMAKVQQLQLHPLKLSGLCNRLKCCLAYECEAYRDLQSRIPARGQRVRTPNGTGDVIDEALLSQEVVVRFDDGSVQHFSAKNVTVVSRTKTRAKARAKRRKAQQQGSPAPATPGLDENNDADDNGAGEP